MAIRRARRLLSLVLMLLLLAVRTPTARSVDGGDWQNAATIERQRIVLEEAYRESLIALSAEKGGAGLVANVRGLCLGSWCAGKATVTSDLDFVVGHPDKAVADRLKQMITQRVETALGTNHKIRVSYIGDPSCRDCFSGQTGETFLYRYAERNAVPGEGTYRPVVEDGVVRVEKAATSDFWTGTRRPVPTEMTNVSTFASESGKFFEMYKTGKSVDDALSAAKYINNIESEIKPGFSSTYKTTLPGTMNLSSDMRQLKDELLAIKRNTQLTSAEREAALKAAFGVTTTAELEREAARFVEKSEAYFTLTRQKLAFFEDVVKAGGTAGAAATGEALGFAERLAAVVAKNPGTAAMGAVDIALLAHHYGVHGADQAFYEQLAVSAVMHGIPPAGMIAIVSGLEKDLVQAAGQAAINALVFTPINDQIVRQSYDETNAFGLFGDDSPFRGLSSASLACRYLGNRTAGGDETTEALEPKLAADIDTYVSMLPKSSRMMFGDAGAGDIRDRFLPYLRADLARSRRLWQGMAARETALHAMSTQLLLADPALRVSANGTTVASNGNVALKVTAQPGGDTVMTIGLSREFATRISRTLPKIGAMQDAWCAARGDWNAYLKWEKAAAAQTTTYELSPDPVRVTATVSGGTGWRVTSALPLAPLASPSATAEAAMFGGWAGSADGLRQFAGGRYRVLVTASEAAKAPVSVSLGFRLKGTAMASAIDERYTVTVTVSPPVPPPPAPVAPAKPEPVMSPVPLDKPQATTGSVPSAAATGAQTTGSSSRDQCVKAAQQELASARAEFERWKTYERGKTPAPFVCTNGSQWWSCIPERFQKVWLALDGKVPQDPWGHDQVPECAGVWKTGTNTQYNECAWPVYLSKLETWVNRKIAECK